MSKHISQIVFRLTDQSTLNIQTTSKSLNYHLDWLSKLDFLIKPKVDLNKKSENKEGLILELEENSLSKNNTDNSEFEILEDRISNQSGTKENVENSFLTNCQKKTDQKNKEGSLIEKKKESLPNLTNCDQNNQETELIHGDNKETTKTKYPRSHQKTTTELNQEEMENFQNDTKSSPQKGTANLVGMEIEDVTKQNNEKKTEKKKEEEKENEKKEKENEKKKEEEKENEKKEKENEKEKEEEKEKEKVKEEKKVKENQITDFNTKEKEKQTFENQKKKIVCIQKQNKLSEPKPIKSLIKKSKIQYLNHVRESRRKWGQKIKSNKYKYQHPIRTFNPTFSHTKPISTRINELKFLKPKNTKKDQTKVQSTNKKNQFQIEKKKMVPLNKEFNIAKNKSKTEKNIKSENKIVNDNVDQNSAKTKKIKTKESTRRLPDLSLKETKAPTSQEENKIKETNKNETKIQNNKSLDSKPLSLGKQKNQTVESFNTNLTDEKIHNFLTNEITSSEPKTKTSLEKKINYGPIKGNETNQIQSGMIKKSKKVKKGKKKVKKEKNKSDEKINKAKPKTKKKSRKRKLNPNNKKKGLTRKKNPKEEKETQSQKKRRTLKKIKNDNNEEKKEVKNVPTEKPVHRKKSEHKKKKKSNNPKKSKKKLQKKKKNSKEIKKKETKQSSDNTNKTNTIKKIVPQNTNQNQNCKNSENSDPNRINKDQNSSSSKPNNNPFFKKNQKRQKKKKNQNFPDWAYGKQLAQELQKQHYKDPDEIFPLIETCDLETIFDFSKPRFANRTSSFYWTPDTLSWREERDYKMKMGYIYQDSTSKIVMINEN
ncbi:inner centromere protein [Anaeramoeba flamelloides]|uniref:Inner centromere protein n=1 Tax=Anaeramoeba flamelloides TaxID=1746091 RepID=A0ABQ8YHT6_9EUKA|nr:inner centromere protein [Anaeramoeba flamelloides]